MSVAYEQKRYVLLQNGLALPVAPVVLLLGLEARGFKLSRDGDDLLVGPASRLTADDNRQLKLWKRHVLSLIDYQPGTVQ